MNPEQHRKPCESSGENATTKREHDLAAEQAREREENRKAHEAAASNRDRMVKIGRGNQQAGRQGSHHLD